MPKKSSSVLQKTQSGSETSEKILLFGDIQLIQSFRNQNSFTSLEEIKNSGLDLEPLKEINPKALVAKEKPDFLVSTGDIVDLNNITKFTYIDPKDEKENTFEVEIDA